MLYLVSHEVCRALIGRHAPNNTATCESCSCHVLVLSLLLRASSDTSRHTLPLMLTKQPVKTMHDFNEALLSQHYVSSPRTTSRTDTAIRHEQTFIFVALCTITFLTSPFGVKAPFEKSCKFRSRDLRKYGPKHSFPEPPPPRRD